MVVAVKCKKKKNYEKTSIRETARTPNLVIRGRLSLSANRDEFQPVVRFGEFGAGRLGTIVDCRFAVTFFAINFAMGNPAHLFTNRTQRGSQGHQLAERYHGVCVCAFRYVSHFYCDSPSVADVSRSRERPYPGMLKFYFKTARHAESLRTDVSRVSRLACGSEMRMQ